jgi:integrase
MTHYASLPIGVHRDATIPQLSLAVQANGSAWKLRYRHQGKARTLALGPFPALTPQDARRAAQHFAGLVAIGRDPGAERKAARRAAVVAAAPVTDQVERVAARFLKHQRARVRASTWTETKRVFDREILPLWKDKRLSEIGKPDVRKLVDAIAARGSPVSANRCLTILKTFCNFAIREDFLVVSPAASVRQPSPEKARERCFLDEGELSAVWRASLTLGAYGAIVRLLILTGARRSEVANLVWPEIDAAGRVWTLPAARAKNGRSHSVPLSEQAVDVLRWAAPAFGELRGAVFEPQSFSRLKGELDKLLPPDMPGWCIHDLRRSAASGMASLGVQPHVIEACLNDKSGAIRGVAAIYNRFNYASEKRHALDAWAQHVETIQRGLESFSAAA